MIAKFYVTVGALYREEVKTCLQSLHLSFAEKDTNWFSSTIIVIAETVEEQAALEDFKEYCRALAERIQSVSAEEQREQWKNELSLRLAQKKEMDKKLSKRNHLRRLMFRKPLRSV